MIVEIIWSINCF